MLRQQALDMRELLKGIALQAAADSAVYGLDHGSVICRLPPFSWQANMLRKAKGIGRATTPMELRRVMQDPAMEIIFLPADAVITQEVLDDICAQSPLNKTIVWERPKKG